MPTRTDRIKEAIAQELERRRSQVDGDGDLDMVTVSVRLNQHTGRPIYVRFEPKSQREI